MVQLDTKRSSVPERRLGKQVDVDHYFDEVVVCFTGHIVARHPRAIGQRDRRITAAGHHRPLGARARRHEPPPQQQALLQDAPAVLQQYVQALLVHTPGRGAARLKRLLQRTRTYPTEPFLGALEQALTDDLLVIDELGSLTFKPEHANALFKLLEQRYGRQATLITTNLDYEQWYEPFRNTPLVDALLDRLQHHCITIRIDGASLRTPSEPATDTSVSP
jgi:IstB-like ATP binding protein/Mu transposase, C-terminal domain